MKKRTISIFLIAIMSISLVACGTSKKEVATTTPSEVVETTKEAVETPPEPEVPAPVISSNGITVDGEIGDVIDVSANEVNLSDYTDLSAYLSDKTTGTVAYDITTLDKDGNAVQPEGDVTVTVDISAIASNSSGYVVYYVAPEGVFEKMNMVSASSSSIKFTTTHFSVYVVCAYDATVVTEADFAANSETAVPAVEETAEEVAPPAESPKTETPAYTYTDASQAMYAKSGVNVRNLPSTSGTKLGGLSTNDEVVVTGVCNETGWYRIDYNGGVAYVSNSYLVTEKVAVQQPAETFPAGGSSNSSLPECPYILGNYIYGSYDEGFTVYYNRNWTKEDYALGRTRDERYAEDGGDAGIQAYNMMLSYLSLKFYATEGFSYYENHMREDRPFVGKYKDVGDVYCIRIWWE